MDDLPSFAWVWFLYVIFDSGPTIAKMVLGAWLSMTAYFVKKLIDTAFQVGIESVKARLKAGQSKGPEDT